MGQKYASAPHYQLLARVNCEAPHAIAPNIIMRRVAVVLISANSCCAKPEGTSVAEICGEAGAEDGGNGWLQVPTRVFNER